MRRGATTLWVRHGEAQAINAGDLLLMLPTLALDDMEADPGLRWRLSRGLAHYAAEHEQDGKKAAKLLGYTILGGGVFLCVKAYEWYTEISHGMTIQSHPFWSFYYTAAGIHASHVIAGMILMAFVAKDAAKNLELHRVELVGIYWHFVDIVWIFLFPLLYIAK